MLSKELRDQSSQERISPLKLSGADANNLLISEIYRSLQGESTYAGLPCTFIRTTACHLRCHYCDTAHAFKGGQLMSIELLLQRIKELNTPLVELTGGEPLLQKGAAQLLFELCEKNYTVLLETSGAINIQHLDRRVKVILDIKTPGSGENLRNCWSNLDILWPGCEVKFVICDEQDYQFAKQICEKYNLFAKVPVLLSAEAKNMDKTKLAELILKDQLPFRLQVQLHKILWGEKAGV